MEQHPEGGDAGGVPSDPPPFPPFGVHDSERVYDSHWCGLRRDTVVLPGGALQEYHVFEIPDAIVVVPELADGRLVLIGQYRYPHGRTHWEVPAGRVSEGEDPAAAAERELLEEAGVRVGELVPLPGFYPTNGISPHWVHAFAATGCVEVAAPTPDDSEQILVRAFDPADVRRLVASGRIRDAFTALALYHWFEIRRAAGA